MALWILTPLTYARDYTSAFGACLEAAITVCIAIFVISLTLMITNFLTTLFWSILGSLLPFVIPIGITEPISALVDIAAELFLFSIVLGYSWTKTREHFGRGPR